MAEIDRSICGNCKFFKYTGTDKWGYTPNKTGEGICKNPALPKIAINRSMSPRQALEVSTQTDEVKRMEANNTTCFVDGELSFSSEAIEDAFTPTREDRLEWGRENSGLGDSKFP